MLCKLGKNRGIGFDPAYKDERLDSTEKRQLTFIKDYYSESYSSYKGDIICCRQVLEHIKFPRDFLANILDILADSLRTIVFFEVPNGKFIFEDLKIWDLIYEHCSYFCATSLKHLFTFCGFDVFRCTETFEGQFLTIEAFPKRVSTNSHGKLEENIKQMDNYVAAFRKRYDNTVMRWQHKLEKSGRLEKG